MYKTILVYVDETPCSAQRVSAAAQLALRYGARLVGMAVTGVPAAMLTADGRLAGLPVAGSPLADLRAQAESALDGFEAAARAAGASSLERRCVDDDAGIAIVAQARYCDLVVISQAALDQFLPRQRADFPDYVVLHSVRPVLVLPTAGVHGLPGTRITVAWNGSDEAARAIASALPLLQAAQRVDLVMFDARQPDASQGEEAGAGMARYLAEHGVRVELTTADPGGHEDEALLAFAAAKRSDLIVMGAYGRSRLREIMLGGVTRTMLNASPVALWMAR